MNVNALNCDNSYRYGAAWMEPFELSLKMASYTCHSEEDSSCIVQVALGALFFLAGTLSALLTFVPFLIGKTIEWLYDEPILPPAQKALSSSSSSSSGEESADQDLLEKLFASISPKTFIQANEQARQALFENAGFEILLNSSSDEIVKGLEAINQELDLLDEKEKKKYSKALSLFLSCYLTKWLNKEHRFVLGGNYQRSISSHIVLLEKWLEPNWRHLSYGPCKRYYDSITKKLEKAPSKGFYDWAVSEYVQARKTKNYYLYNFISKLELRLFSRAFSDDLKAKKNVNTIAFLEEARARPSERRGWAIDEEGSLFLKKMYEILLSGISFWSHDIEAISCKLSLFQTLNDYHSILTSTQGHQAKKFKAPLHKDQQKIYLENLFKKLEEECSFEDLGEKETSLSLPFRSAEGFPEKHFTHRYDLDFFLELGKVLLEAKVDQDSLKQYTPLLIQAVEKSSAVSLFSLQNIVAILEKCPEIDEYKPKVLGWMHQLKSDLSSSNQWDANILNQFICVALQLNIQDKACEWIFGLTQEMSTEEKGAHFVEHLNTLNDANNRKEFILAVIKNFESQKLEFQDSFPIVIKLCRAALNNSNLIESLNALCVFMEAHPERWKEALARPEFFKTFISQMDYHKEDEIGSILAQATSKVSSELSFSWNSFLNSDQCHVNVNSVKVWTVMGRWWAENNCHLAPRFFPALLGCIFEIRSQALKNYYLKKALNVLLRIKGRENQKTHLGEISIYDCLTATKEFASFENLETLRDLGKVVVDLHLLEKKISEEEGNESIGLFEVYCHNLEQKPYVKLGPLYILSAGLKRLFAKSEMLTSKDAGLLFRLLDLFGKFPNKSRYQEILVFLSRAYRHLILNFPDLGIDHFLFFKKAFNFLPKECKTRNISSLLANIQKYHEVYTDSVPILLDPNLLASSFLDKIESNCFSRYIQVLSEELLKFPCKISDFYGSPYLDQALQAYTLHAKAFVENSEESFLSWENLIQNSSLTFESAMALAKIYMTFVKHSYEKRKQIPEMIFLELIFEKIRYLDFVSYLKDEFIELTLKISKEFAQPACLSIKASLELENYKTSLKDLIKLIRARIDIRKYDFDLDDLLTATVINQTKKFDNRYAAAKLIGLWVSSYKEPVDTHFFDQTRKIAIFPFIECLTSTVIAYSELFAEQVPVVYAKPVMQFGEIAEDNAKEIARHLDGPSLLALRAVNRSLSERLWHPLVQFLAFIQDFGREENLTELKTALESDSQISSRWYVRMVIDILEKVDAEK